VAGWRPVEQDPFNFHMFAVPHSTQRNGRKLIAGVYDRLISRSSIKTQEYPMRLSADFSDYYCLNDNCTCERLDRPHRSQIGFHLTVKQPSLWMSTCINKHGELVVAPFGSIGRDSYSRCCQCQYQVKMKSDLAMK